MQQVVKRRHFGPIATIIILFAIFIVALLTNPSHSKHQEALKQVAITAAKHEMMKDDNALTVIFGGLVIDQIVDALIAANVTYKNNWIYSICTIEKDGQSKVVSIGAMGKVFTLSKDNLQKVETSSLEAEQKKP